MDFIEEAKKLGMSYEEIIRLIERGYGNGSN